MWGIFARCSEPCNCVAEEGLFVDIAIPLEAGKRDEPDGLEENEKETGFAVMDTMSPTSSSDPDCADMVADEAEAATPRSPHNNRVGAADWKRSAVPLSSVSTTVSASQSTACTSRSASQSDVQRGGFARRPSQDTSTSSGGLLDVTEEIMEVDGLTIVDPESSMMTRAQSNFFSTSSVAELGSKAPVFKAELDAPLSAVWAQLATLSCRPQVRLIQEFHRGLDVQATPWLEDYEGEALVRQVSYKMPLTGSSTLASFVSMPEFSDVSSLCRLSSLSTNGQQEIVMQEEVSTAGVPLADVFRCLVTLSFKARPGGGVLFQKWVEIRWVKPLSWKQRPLRIPLEVKVTKDAEGSGRSLHRILKQELLLTTA